MAPHVQLHLLAVSGKRPVDVVPECTSTWVTDPLELLREGRGLCSSAARLASTCVRQA
jgi:hypothetical protein